MTHKRAAKRLTREQEERRDRRESRAVECPKCESWLSCSVWICPCCGHFMPGRRLLKLLVIVALLVAAVGLSEYLLKVSRHLPLLGY